MFLFSGNRLEYLGIEQYQETIHTHTQQTGRKEREGEGGNEKKANVTKC